MTIDELHLDSLTSEDKKRIQIIYKALLLYRDRAEATKRKSDIVIVERMIDYWQEQFTIILSKENLIGGVYDS